MLERCSEWGWFHPMWFFVFLIVMTFVWSRFWFWGNRGHGNWQHGRDPIEHLKARYARGEITKEEFGSIKRDLKD